MGGPFGARLPLLTFGWARLGVRSDGDGGLQVPNPDDKLTKPCYDLRGFLDNFTWLDKVASGAGAP